MPIIPILIFIAGLFCLIKGADWIAKYATRLATMWGISEFSIGVTLVAMATSLPEFSVSLLSAITQLLDPTTHAIDIASGTIIGSNIANIALILGFAALLRPITTTEQHHRESYFMAFITFLLAAILLVGMDLIGGLIIIAAFLFFFGFIMGRQHTHNPMTHIRIFIGKMKTRDSIIALVLACVGGIVVVLGSVLVINSVLELSFMFGIPEFLIAMLVIAIGTSLPELAASVVAALRGFKSLAVGNVIGSNIFNIFALALTALITTIDTTSIVIFNSYIMILFTLLFLIFARTRSEISKKEGVVLFLGYIVFISLQIIM